MTGDEPVVYGLVNCDTVKRARSWLAAHGVDHRFHDFRKLGLASAEASVWVAEHGVDRLLNRRGTTWRKLAADQQAAAGDATSAVALICDQPSLIKRPVVRWPDGTTSVGFDETAFAARIGEHR